MAAPKRGYPDADTFVTPSRLRLADATRRLIAAVLTAEDLPEDRLDAAVAATERAVAALEASATAAQGNGPRHSDYLPRSPLVGTISPVAPPLSWEVDGSRVLARGSFGAACEGPPGYVHGGWIALAFDEALGMANVASGRSGMTGRLTVRYRRPTPLHTDVLLEAWTERVEGRRFTTVGTLRVGNDLTAQAEGLFIAIGAERALEYFGERPATAEPTDPLP
jgi:acyl-coenzyme A thioesterase PaaI-like protein